MSNTFGFALGEGPQICLSGLVEQWVSFLPLFPPPHLSQRLFFGSQISPFERQKASRYQTVPGLEELPQHQGGVKAEGLP